jgi:hypothetical protein
MIHDAPGQTAGGFDMTAALLAGRQENGSKVVRELICARL